MNAVMPIEPFMRWLAFGERGISSETIVGHLTGHPGLPKNGWTSHPYDPDDFRRCERLLRQVPLARLFLPVMRSASPVWAALVDSWDEIVGLMEWEAPGCFDRDRQYSSCPQSYDLMRWLIEPAKRVTA